MHIMKFLGITKNACGQKQETSNQPCLAWDESVCKKELRIIDPE